MKGNQMLPTINRQPVFRWCQDNMDHSLLCGGVLIAKLRFRGRDNGFEHYQIEQATFSDALDSEGWRHWDSQSFRLKGKTFAEIAEIVEKFYTNIFERLDFTMTLEWCHS
jgi:hypothetical protein